MTRSLFFAISLIGTGVLLNSPVDAMSAARCEDQAANCGGRCAIYAGGAGDVGGRQNKCMLYCARQVNRCLVNASIFR
jgi:hypothetical protein